MNEQALKYELAKWEWMKPHLEDENFDAVAMMSALESETNITECLLEIAESAIADEHSVEAIQSRIKELQERASRLTNRAEKKRRVISATMQNLEIPKIEGPNATLSMRKGGRELIIMDEALIPCGYFVPQPEKLDRRKLKEDLETMTVPGAQLNNGASSVTIRTK